MKKATILAIFAIVFMVAASWLAAEDPAESYIYIGYASGSGCVGQVISFESHHRSRKIEATIKKTSRQGIDDPAVTYKEYVFRPSEKKRMGCDVYSGSLNTIRYKWEVVSARYMD